MLNKSCLWFVGLRAKNVRKVWNVVTTLCEAGNGINKNPDYPLEICVFVKSSL